MCLRDFDCQHAVANLRCAAGSISQLRRLWQISVMHGELHIGRVQAFGVVALGSLGGMAFPAISSIKANNVADSEQGTIQASQISCFPPRGFPELVLFL